MLRFTPQQPRPPMVKLCANCRHLKVIHKGASEHSTCTLFGKVNLITGAVFNDHATDVRSDPSMCGLNATYFSAINTPPFYDGRNGAGS